MNDGGRENMDGGRGGGFDAVAQTDSNRPAQMGRGIDGNSTDATASGNNRDGGLDARPGIDASVALSDAGFDAPNVLRPGYRLINARWLTTPARCGDEVRLRATVVGYPPDQAARVEIFAVNTGMVLTTLNVQLQAGVIQARYRVYALSANWRTDRIKFRVYVPGISISGESDNELTLRNRPTTSWETIREILPATPGGSAPHRIYDQSLEASRVHISLKIRLTGMSLMPTERISMKRSIENVWNNGFNPRYKFRRRNCVRGAQCPGDSCNVEFHLDVNFVEAGQHITVDMRDGTIFDASSQTNQYRGENTSRTTADHRMDGLVSRIDSGLSCAGSRLRNIRGSAGDECTTSIWYRPPGSSTTYAHEVGHVLGCYDEYFDGTYDPQGYQPHQLRENQAIPPANQTLMSSPGVTTMLPRLYRYFLFFLNQHTDGDEYAIYDTATGGTYRFP